MPPFTVASYLTKTVFVAVSAFADADAGENRLDFFDNRSFAVLVGHAKISRGNNVLFVDGRVSGNIGFGIKNAVNHLSHVELVSDFHRALYFKGIFDIAFGVADHVIAQLVGSNLSAGNSDFLAAGIGNLYGEAIRFVHCERLAVNDGFCHVGIEFEIRIVFAAAGHCQRNESHVADCQRHYQCKRTYGSQKSFKFLHSCIS